MTASLAIPRTAEDFTPAWLESALRHGGQLRGDAGVSTLDVTPLSEGVGFIGQVMRLVPAYSGEAGGLPRSLIAKIPTIEPGGREIAALYGLYERELQFYRRFATRITFRVPGLYFGDGDTDAGDYVLLLEDLGDTGVLCDQITGCDREQAGIAVRALARHHATWWGHEALSEPWLGVGVDLVRASMTQAYGASWRPFLDLFGHCLSPDVQAAVPALDARILALMDEYEEGPLTLIHGDYRADNMFFGKPQSGYDLAIIDWQSPNRGWAAYDLSYFICGSVSAEMRQRHERDLLREYYDEFASAGSAQYDRAQFEEDYARSLLVYLAIFVVNGATLDPANERGLTLMNAIFDRLNGAIADAGALQHLKA